MTAQADTLKLQLNALSPAERAELARYLLESLDTAADPAAELMWTDELNRRAMEVRSGQAGGRPASEAFAELRQRYS